MRALRYAAFGPIAEVLRIEDLPAPVPAAHEVVIDVHAVGINPLDWKLVEGQFRLMAKSRPPCGVGAEFAGHVRLAGSNVTTLRVGDRVVAWLNPFKEPPRALAEQAVVPATQCVVVPEPVPLDIAAVVPVAGLSALQLAAAVAVRPGQRILVHGAAGGVGSCLVSVLRDAGAAVVATGSADSQQFLRTLRPDAQVDYASPPSSWPGPFDAVIDCAARLDTAAIAALLPRGGEFAVTLPSFPGVIFDPLLNRFRRLRRHTLRLEPDAGQVTELLKRVADGRLSIALTRRFPFEQAIDALLASRSGHARGKLAVVLQRG
jgi:NADPH:quinone reductase-like Zn-dependent oxidoreductase